MKLKLTFDDDLSQNCSSFVTFKHILLFHVFVFHQTLLFLLRLSRIKFIQKSTNQLKQKLKNNLIILRTY